MGLLRTRSSFLKHFGALPTSDNASSELQSILDNPIHDIRRTRFTIESPRMTSSQFVETTATLPLMFTGLGEAEEGAVMTADAIDGTLLVRSITTPYAVETQSASAAAQGALAEAQNGATLYRMGELGKSMAGESQYWALQNPLTPGYANQIGMPGVTPNFIIGGTANPGSVIITNEAAGLGANAGGGIQVITSPRGVSSSVVSHAGRSKAHETTAQQP